MHNFNSVDRLKSRHLGSRDYPNAEDIWKRSDVFDLLIYCSLIFASESELNEGVSTVDIISIFSSPDHTPDSIPSPCKPLSVGILSIASPTVSMYMQRMDHSTHKQF